MATFSFCLTSLVSGVTPVLAGSLKSSVKVDLVNDAAGHFFRLDILLSRNQECQKY